MCAILKKGKIQPLEELPPHWREGQELVVETCEPSDNPASIQEWYDELVRLGADPGRGSRTYGCRHRRAGARGQGVDAPGVGNGMMAGFLLDTNHVGMAVKPASLVAQRVLEARRAGARLGTCLPVLCEIEVGLRQVRHKSTYRRELNHLLREIRLWPIDLKTTEIYGDIHMQLRRRGRILSQVDIMIAALAKQMKLTILTTDRDFEGVPEIRTADWSQP